MSASGYVSVVPIGRSWLIVRMSPGDELIELLGSRPHQAESVQVALGFAAVLSVECRSISDKANATGPLSGDDP